MTLPLASLRPQLRILARLALVAALCGALAGLPVPGRPVAAQAAASFRVQIAPMGSGTTATRAGDRISVSPTEDRAPAGAITAARLVGVEADGGVQASSVPEDRLNRDEQLSGSDYLVNDGGEIRGRLTLGCLFSAPSPACNRTGEPIRQMFLEVDVAGVTGDSNRLRVDYTRPEYRRADRTPDARRVRVVFSEPVRHPQGDAPFDWEVTNPSRRVLAVEPAQTGDCSYDVGEDSTAGPTGCTRTLVLDVPLGEDEQPTVRYATVGVPSRPEYVDAAGNRAFVNIANRVLERIRPPRPPIEVIGGSVVPGGTEGAEVAGNDPAPVARVGGIAAGHEVFLRVTQPGQSPQDTTPRPADADGPVHVSLPDLVAGDATYSVQAIVRDPNGNLSTDPTRSERPDQAPSTIRYVLDTVRPTVAALERQGTRQAVVTFTEALAPEGDAGRWTINGEAATAAGSGNQRTVTAASELRELNTISWEPAGSTYADAAGNPLVPFSGLELIGLPRLQVPLIDTPAAEQYRNSDTFTIGGVAEEGTHVQVFDQGAEQPRATVPVGEDRRWTAEVSYSADGRYRPEAAAVDQTTGASSARVAAPALVRDTRAPSVDVRSPSLGAPELPSLDPREGYAIGDSVPIRWVGADDAPEDPAQPDHGHLSTVAIRFLEGTREVVRKAYVRGIDDARYQITRADLDNQLQRQAQFDVSIVDLAGNPGTDRSDPVLLRADIVGYTPVLVQHTPRGSSQDSIVEARFGSRLQGTTTPADWRIDGLVPRSVQMVERDGRTVVVLTAVQAITDPNPVPAPPDDQPGALVLSVQYQPQVTPVQALRTEDNVSVSERERTAFDGIAPVLSANSTTGGPINAGAVRITGGADETADPNTVRAIRLDAAGERAGGAIASTTASPQGPWALDVPLLRNARNRFVIEASDRAGNTTAVGPVTVVEDSAPPLVTVVPPAIPPTPSVPVTVRWVTVDVHPDLVDVEFRRNAGPWQTIVSGVRDTGAFEWLPPSDLRVGDVVDLRVLAVDLASNRGAGIGSVRVATPSSGPGTNPPPGPGTNPPPGTGTDLPPNVPVLVGAKATSERTVEVVFSDAVSTAAGDAGFSIVQGPGVEAVEGTGATRVLRLSSDLTTTTPTVSYNGQGVVDTAGRAVPAARIVATRGFVFGVQGLVGSANRNTGVVRLSWTDERNLVEHVDRYEVRRGDELVATVPADVRTAVDTGLTGSATYTVTAVDDLGNVSRPTSITVSSTAPNITPKGGFVLSDDGQVALLVPPNAVDEDHFGSFVPRDPADLSGFRRLLGDYELVVEAADDDAPLQAFARYSCLSFRPTDGRLVQAEQARTTVLRTGVVPAQEIATRAGERAADGCVLSTGRFALGEARGPSLRVSGADPVLVANRFATAAGLSQVAFAAADTVVIARADDYPDALAATALAGQRGAPVLLAETGRVPAATVLEIHRLGARRAVLVGGTAALAPVVEQELSGLGLEVERVSGPTRFHTAAQVANRVGAFGGRAFLTTGEGFADALSAAGGSSLLTRPIFLTNTGALPDVTLAGMREAGVTTVEVVGGTAAVSDAVVATLRAEGFTVTRVSGRDRYETAVALAAHLGPEGLSLTRPLLASGQGDGKTSPDALAAGPTAAMFGSSLLLVPPRDLHPAVAEALREAQGLRGVVIAGGGAAVSEAVRSEVDRTRQ